MKRVRVLVSKALRAPVSQNKVVQMIAVAFRRRARLIETFRCARVTVELHVIARLKSDVTSSYGRLLFDLTHITDGAQVGFFFFYNPMPPWQYFWNIDSLDIREVSCSDLASMSNRSVLTPRLSATG